MRMMVRVCALVAGVAMVPAAAMADDPRDPTMRSAAARAKDRAIIRQMNQQQLAYVRARDARQMRAYDATRQRHRDDYADAQADYARRMSEWRRAVSACNEGRWDYCD